VAAVADLQEAVTGLPVAAAVAAVIRFPQYQLHPEQT
jgi:hypothetical protein